MRTHRAMSMVAIVGVPALGMAVPAAEASIFTPGLSAQTEAYDYTVGPSVGDLDSDAGTMSGPFVVSESMASRAGSVSESFAQSAYGYLRVDTSTVGQYSASAADMSIGQAIGTASFSDQQVVVLREGIATGTPGTFTARFNVQRFIDFGASLVQALEEGTVLLEGGYSLQIVIGETVAQIGGSDLDGTWRRVGVNGPLQEPDVVDAGIVEMDIDFLYGVEFTIAAEVSVNLFTMVADGGTVDVDSELLLGPSFHWLGIVGGIDEETTVSSPDVEDWKRAAVPSPGGGVVLALLGVCAAVRRR